MTDFSTFVNFHTEERNVQGKADSLEATIWIESR